MFLYDIFDRNALSGVSVTRNYDISTGLCLINAKPSRVSDSDSTGIIQH